MTRLLLVLWGRPGGLPHNPGLAIALLATLLVSAASAAQAPAGPLEALRARDRQIHDILARQKRDATPENDALLRQAVNDAFDYEAHTQASFGRYWAELSEPDRKEALRLVSTLLERSALDKVKEYSTEKIQYVSETIDPSGRNAEVLTRVTRKNETAEIAYRMQPAGGRWRIVDIVVEGAGSIESNRAAFYKEIRASGVRGLLDKLRRKAERQSP
jgi:phospholipid transport system substrate-binding protein